MRFNPKANDTIGLYLNGREVTFAVAPHPDPSFRAARFPHAMSGERSTIWHIRDLDDNQEYALEVPNSRYSDRPALEQVCVHLDNLKSIEGLESSARFCLTPELAAPTIQQYPDLEYSMLMPWIKGTSWFDAHQDHERTRSLRTLTRWQCLQLAHQLACVLSELERRGDTHCALCPENLMVETAPGQMRVELLGLEDMISPGLPLDNRSRIKLPGYAHPAYSQAGVDAAYDRFPGALLLSEMLGWFDDNVHAQCSAESYFDPDELQCDSSQKLQTLANALRQHHPDLATLLSDT